MIAALARESATLAKAGLALTEPVRHQVEQIPHRVLADPTVAREWAAGRLIKAPEATGRLRCGHPRHPFPPARRPPPTLRNHRQNAPAVRMPPAGR